MWMNELTQVLDQCKQMDDSLVNERHSGLETYEPPASVAFDAVLSLIESLPLPARHQAIEMVDTYLADKPAFYRREVASSYTLPTIVAGSGWPAVRSLTLMMKDKSGYREIMTCPSIARIEDISFLGTDIDEPLIHTLSQSPYSIRLQVLEFSGCSFSEAAETAFDESLLLRKLSALYGASFENPEQTAPLQLRKVSCYGSPNTLRQLNDRAGHTLRELTVVSLEGDVANAIETLLSAKEMLNNLESLTFSMSLDDLAVERVSACSHLSALEKLAFGAGTISAKGIQSLRSAPFLPKLRHLDLSLNPIGDEGWLEISRLPVVKLESVRLFGTDGGDGGVLALASSPSLSKCKRLEIGGNAIGHLGIDALVSSGNMSMLEFLDLRDNPIGQRGACSLASATSLGSLRHLRLNSTNKVGAAAILGSSHFGSLRSLGLGFLDDGSKEDPVAAISRSGQFGGLVALYLVGAITDAGLIALCKSLQADKLMQLTLSGTVTDVGIDALAQSGWLVSLWKLYLDLCPIGDKGAGLLGLPGVLSQLHDLRIRHCNLTKSGSTLLANSEMATRLRWVTIDKELYQPWLDSPRVSPLVKARIREAIASEQ